MGRYIDPKRIVTFVRNHTIVNPATVLDGVFWADTYCNGYDHYRALPQVIQFQGKTLVKMGWNSDIMMASYKESDSFALYK